MGKRSKAGKQKKSPAWNALSAVAAVGAAAVAKKGLDASWRVATGKNPPANPADPDVELREAILWAAASGTIIALARMLATRKAATYYAQSTGQLPPTLRKDGQKATSSDAQVA
ncbi:DUF4235 domain-containing protein [Nocardioides yefusunii]|uniref:DUF4235 domain-containing protein n=1 Tax=Nocardioides yefusunii TaxID=2500546 RepID=A0ABW1QVX9_9ACTN|nr:DUF4235 domain-containing protein [Nocardioides yefusunii]